MRYLWDPELPKELSGIRFAASVEPASEEIVWLVDGAPVAKVGYPHELRYSLPPGRHVVQAAMARSQARSRPVTVVVED